MPIDLSNVSTLLKKLYDDENSHLSPGTTQDYENEIESYYKLLKAVINASLENATPKGIDQSMQLSEPFTLRTISKPLNRQCARMYRHIKPLSEHNESGTRSRESFGRRKFRGFRSLCSMAFVGHGYDFKA
jgi:hypothetical protein